MTEIMSQENCLLGLMSLADFLNENIEMLDALQIVRFEEITPQLWASFGAAAKELSEFLSVNLEAVKNAPKVVTDDAAYAHMTTVLLAD